MIAFYLEKLIEILQLAMSRNQLILQVCTHLRDSQAKSFCHESMAGALCERIGDLSTSSAGLSGGGTAEAGRCAWHNNGEGDLCLLRSQTNRAKAQECAKWVVDQKRAIPTSDAPELLAKALLKFVRLLLAFV